MGESNIKNPNIMKLETEEDFQLLNDNIDNIINDNVYESGRDWTEEEISLFVKQFQDYQKTDDAPEIDMNRLDPNFISLQDYKEKFSGFDDEVLQYMVECENKKLEDARVPPLIIRNENITLTESLSKVIINDEESCKSKTKCQSSCKDSIGGLESEKEEKEIQED